MLAPRQRPRSWTRHAWAIGWVLVAGVAPLLPALAHHAASLHDPGRGADQLDYFIPSTVLTWTQVHSGHLPLWNPYNALGLPLWFNWQSAATSVPALVSYLVPLHFAYTTQILVTLVIAGTGVYVLGAVLGLGPLGCAVAATLYELSGPFMGALGWPVAAVMSWAGWLFAGAVLVVRGERRGRAIVLSALALGLSIYAGQPEAVALMLAVLAIFLVVVLGARADVAGGQGPILRPLVDLAVAGVVGTALAAPLLLPGVQVATGSMSDVHLTVRSYHILLAPSSLLYATGGTAYEGIIAVALAVTAVAIRRRRVEAIAFAVVALVTGLLAFASPIAAAANQLPFFGTVDFEWATVPMAFAVALGAGMGADALVRSDRDRSAQRSLRVRAMASFGGVSLAYIALLAFAAAHARPGQGPRALRLWWPALEVVIGVGALLIVPVLAAGRRRLGRIAGQVRRHVGALVVVTMLGGEAAFLATAATSPWSSGPTTLTPPALATAIKDAVGPSLVAEASHYCFPISLGILQNENIVYGVHELAAYDPAIPRAYFQSWTQATGMPAGAQLTPPIYCPAVTSSTLARRYGVSYVLALHGTPGPTGARFVKRLDDEDLYRVPGSGAATVTALGPDGALPPVDAVGTTVAVSHPGPASWLLRPGAAKASVLRLHLTDISGWHASIDGKPLALMPYDGVVLEARIPAGHHVVELHYWPDALTLGLVVAGSAVVGMATVGIVLAVTRRRRALT